MLPTSVPLSRLQREVAKRRAAEATVTEQAATIGELQRRLDAAVSMIASLRRRLDELERELANRRSAPQFGSLRATLGRPA